MTARQLMQALQNTCLKTSLCVIIEQKKIERFIKAPELMMETPLRAEDSCVMKSQESKFIKFHDTRYHFSEGF